MGFRYRKSIHLGGGFRINLSKSGIGYSWGVKGFRITKTARGTTRRTVSLPGTGISYVQETGKRGGYAPGRGRAWQPAPGNNHYDTQVIANQEASKLVSEGLEEMLASAGRALKLMKLFTIGLWITLLLGLGYPLFWIFAAGFASMMLYVRTKGRIDLEYEIDEDRQSEVDQRMDPLIRITRCAKVWRVTQTSRVIDRKYAAGAGNTVNRSVCAVSTTPPFPFRTNVRVASFKTGRETLLFLPDKLFIIQGSKVGALHYSDIASHAHTTRFVESGPVPTDARIVGQTWKYVNKSGGPDKRFKDNRQLPVCLYGELELTSPAGLHTVLMFSNPDVH